jgi:hypothetical protein
MSAAKEAIPAGFVPMETRSELPATESLRSPNLHHPLLPLSPPTSMYSVDLLTPIITSPDAAATFQAIVNDSVVYPQDGPSELEAPVDASQIISLSSSADQTRPSTGNSWAQEETDTSKTATEIEDTSQASSNKTMVPSTKEEAIAVLDRANALLRYASHSVDSSPSDARRAFADALSQYRRLEVFDPPLAVRKYRSMVNAELGLSLVVSDQAKHITRAENLCVTAMKFARRSPNRSDVHGTMLDSAKLKGRYARVHEKMGTSPMVVKAIQGDAFDLFQGVAAELASTCSSIEDVNTLAQALLGTARMAKMLQTAASPGARQVAPPEIYLHEALKRIAEAQRSGVSPGPAADRLMETRMAVAKLLNHR